MGGPIGCELGALEDDNLEVETASVGTGRGQGSLAVCHSPGIVHA